MSTPSMFRGRFVELEDFLQAGEALLWIDVEDFGLLVLVQLAAFAQALEHLDFVAQPGRLLKLKLGRCGRHFLPHFVEQLLAVAFEKHSQPLDVVAIFFLADPQVAGGRALVDRRQQARPEPAPALVIGLDVERTGAELEHLLQSLHRAAQAARVGERSVQLRAARARLARHLDARKILMRGDLQVREAFVVAQLAVVFGLDVLHQPRFHEHGVDLALGLDEIDVIGLAH